MKYLGCLILTSHPKSIPTESVSVHLTYNIGIKFYSFENSDAENSLIEKMSPYSICICGKKHIMNNFYIKNDEGNIEIWGSQCIKKFLLKPSNREIKKSWESNFYCMGCNKRAISSPLNGSVNFIGDKNTDKKINALLFQKTGCCKKCIDRVEMKKWEITKNPVFYNHFLKDIINDIEKRKKLMNLLSYGNEKGWANTDKWLKLKKDLNILYQVERIHSMA